MIKKKIYTFGYTLFDKKTSVDIQMMYETLRRYGVSYIADVRSVPFSKSHPECNSNNLKNTGINYSVPYIHMSELGAKADVNQNVFSKAEDIFFDDIFPIAASKRPEKTELRKNEEIVDFNKFRSDEKFSQGIQRIKNAYEKDYTLALMCSEKDPINCHRYFLISKKIELEFGDWIEVEHLIEGENGKITTITNQELDKILQESILKKEEVKRLNLFVNNWVTNHAQIDNYFGQDYTSKLNDFCDRYWNLMHGWKKLGNNVKNEEYD